MAEHGFLEQKPRSPGSLALVIALHGAAIAALVLAKTEFVRVPTVITKTYTVKEPPPPPVEKVEPKDPSPKQQVRSRIETVPPIVDRPVFNTLEIPEPKYVDPVPFDPGPVGPAKADPPANPPLPKPEPVRTEAQLDSRSRLQPTYPAAEERAEISGSVTVIVVIGADGRVKKVEKVSAASDNFFRATEQQALRHWRFKPAMIDGKPVESRKRMTVHFRLDA